ncbi:hypothetical protein [Meiothermus sp.]|uniref:hypothetical protein n=1 Tax=Meiothermus sp. TaxID=1955249 RepID=UPI0021DEF9E5|nr:hypothetical protein [Meiothermus sp.]GIW32873.1 MAG: hypothetical protein KatS3mg072_0206 [Meiothermus sp.]
MNELPPLLTIEEVRRLIGRHRVGRDQLYKLARQYGMALGKRYLMPRRVVVALLEGRLDELELETKNPAGPGGVR